MYSTAQEAAIAFLKKYNPRSIRMNREIAGHVYKLAKTYNHTQGQILGPAGGQILNTCPSKSQLAGIVHCHARHDGTLISGGVDYNEVFSQTDLTSARLRQVPSWVATPSGDIHRFNPDTNLSCDSFKITRNRKD